MTNGEKIIALTGRKPFIDTFVGSPYMVFAKEWWNSEYQEPSVQVECQKWIEAIEDIKAEVSHIIDEIDYRLMDIDISACDVDHYNREMATVKGILDIITKHTKELMK